MIGMSRANALAVCLVAGLCLAAAGAARARLVGVTTYHYDNYRTGWNQSETKLTQSNVNSASFGLLSTTTVDDQVDAQPLIVTGLTINGSRHNVVYVATESNSVYAIDASSGQVLLQTNLGPPVSFLNLPGACNNNGPNVGITSTPVIDPKTGTLYVIAYSWESNAPLYRIHALSLTTLADTVAPMVVSASGMLTDGSTYQFNPAVSRQRTGLLLANNTIYAGFSSFCDFATDKSRGWVLGWQAGTLTPLANNKLTNHLPTSPNNYFLSSVWMSGFGLASNVAGSIFFATGNSDSSGTSYNPVTNIAESAVKMSADLTTVRDLFTPSDQPELDQNDNDFGAGGLMLVPPQPHRLLTLAVGAGKDGNLYVLDANRLKKNFGVYQIDECWCGPSYYRGSDGVGRIVTSGGSTLRVWTIGDGPSPTLTLESQFTGIANGQDGGFFTSVSSSGMAPGTAIIWAVGRPTDGDPGNIDLYAINGDTGQLLWSAVAGQWPNVNSNSNIVPVVANGLVYVASNQTFTIFGAGGTSDVVMPKIWRADMRPPLAPGHQEIFGTVESVAGSAITIRTRGGALVHLDSTEAGRRARLVRPVVGRALGARGTYDDAGVLHAEVILRVKSRPAMWPADR